jgi:hypothetical protein
MICSVLGVLCAELVVGARMPAPSKMVAASTAELRITSSSVPSLKVLSMQCDAEAPATGGDTADE